ncbi:hypothetical protein [Ponticaulis koreensis]|uniref:hypothetical protein n=1 Tax=Ponticaulis koreensis TaxID=1123045 RepID=UPI0003B3A93B|nr:hypothetical protein [Ponticaulis koreensis]
MRKKSRILALQIAAMLEENSTSDIYEAVEILEECGHQSALLKFLSKSSGRRKLTEKSITSSTRRQDKPIEQITSQAVLLLEKSEPEKHKILLNFDKLVRNGDVLATNDALKRFGEKISKEFNPRSSKKDNISAVMKLLAPMKQEEIELHVKRALEDAQKRDGDEFLNLASFLMNKP